MEPLVIFSFSYDQVNPMTPQAPDLILRCIFCDARAEISGR
jgi:hypothetical protein